MNSARKKIPAAAMRTAPTARRWTIRCASGASDSGFAEFKGSFRSRLERELMFSVMVVVLSGAGVGAGARVGGGSRGFGHAADVALVGGDGGGCQYGVSPPEMSSGCAT